MGLYFDYDQYKITDIYGQLEDEIYGSELRDDFEVEEYIHKYLVPEEEAEYMRENYRTIPNPRKFSPETIKEFEEAIKLLKKVEIYVHRIDYLLSDEEHEETFHKKLKRELENLRVNGDI